LICLYKLSGSSNSRGLLKEILPTQKYW